MLLALLFCYRRRPWTTAIAGNSRRATTPSSPSIQQAKALCRYRLLRVQLLHFRVMKGSLMRTRSRSSALQLMTDCPPCAPTARPQACAFAAARNGRRDTGVLKISSYMCCKKSGIFATMISLKKQIPSQGVILPLNRLICYCHLQFSLDSSLHVPCS